MSKSESSPADKAGDGMATCVGGQFAVCVNEKSPTYGWVHQRHPDGQWVTVRKATDDEITRGKAAYEACRDFWEPVERGARTPPSAGVACVPWAWRLVPERLTEDMMNSLRASVRVINLAPPDEQAAYQIEARYNGMWSDVLNIAPVAPSAKEAITDEMVEKALAAANGAMVDTRRFWTDVDKAAVRAMLEAVRG